MPVKYFCDVCGIEVDNPAMSLDMTGKILCFAHYQEYQDNNLPGVYIYKTVWDKDRFKFPKGIKKFPNTTTS